VFGWVCVKDDLQLDQNSKGIEGRVIRGYSHPLTARGGEPLRLIVEFQPLEQLSITLESDASGTIVKAELTTGKVEVTYSPEEPELSRITRFASFPYQFLIELGGLMILGNLLCLRRFLKIRKI
jgi:hypothetical protein